MFDSFKNKKRGEDSFKSKKRGEASVLPVPPLPVEHQMDVNVLARTLAVMVESSLDRRFQQMETQMSSLKDEMRHIHREMRALNINALHTPTPTGAHGHPGSSAHVAHQAAHHVAQERSAHRTSVQSKGFGSRRNVAPERSKLFGRQTLGEPSALSLPQPQPLMQAESSTRSGSGGTSSSAPAPAAVEDDESESEAEAEEIEMQERVKASQQREKLMTKFQQQEIFGRQSNRRSSAGLSSMYMSARVAESRCGKLFHRFHDSKLLLHPTDGFRVGWDLMSILLVLYIAAWLPFQIAFHGSISRASAHHVVLPAPGIDGFALVDFIIGAPVTCECVSVAAPSWRLVGAPVMAPSWAPLAVLLGPNPQPERSGAQATAASTAELAYNLPAAQISSSSSIYVSTSALPTYTTAT